MRLNVRSLSLVATLLMLAVSAAWAQSSVTVVPSGTQIPMVTDQAIDATSANVGKTFLATVNKDVTSNNQVLIPRGSKATLVVTQANYNQNSNGNNNSNNNNNNKDVTLDLTSLTVNGTSYNVSIPGSQTSGSSTPGGIGTNKRTGEYIGGGALAGTIIGAIAGGGKGALIGAIAGGAAGAGAQVLTHGKQVNIPAETQLNYKLNQDVTLTTNQQ